MNVLYCGEFTPVESRVGKQLAQQILGNNHSHTFIKFDHDYLTMNRQFVISQVGESRYFSTRFDSVMLGKLLQNVIRSYMKTLPSVGCIVLRSEDLKSRRVDDLITIAYTLYDDDLQVIIMNNYVAITHDLGYLRDYVEFNKRPAYAG